jgi:hypothetical protein
LALYGNRILVTDISSKGELTVKAYDLKGENEIVLLDDEPDIRDGSFQYNNDGTLISVIVDNGDNVKLRLISIKNAEVIAESDPFVDILNVSLAYKGEAVYFTAENEDGTLQLYTLKAGEQRQVASGFGIQAQFDLAGKTLVYMVSDENAKQNIRVHPMGNGEDVDVMDGENLSFTLVTLKDILLIKEENQDKGDITLYSAKADGSALTKIFSDSDVSVNTIYNPTDTDRLLFEVSNQDGLNNVFATRFGNEEGQYLLEDWSALSFLNIHNDTLVMSGAENSGDDTILFALDLTGKNDLVELDTDDIQQTLGTIFSPDGRKVIYTVQTGDNYDDYEVRQVPLNGKEDYEVLYKEAILIDAAWAKDIFPFDYIWFGSPMYSSNACPGAIALSLDATLTNQLKSDIGETCFRFKAQADKEYTFFAIGKDDQDLYLDLMDKDGNYLASDADSGPGYNPAIYWTNGTEPMTVYVKVSGSTSETLDFELTAKEGTFDPSMVSAILIPTDGSEISGTVENADLLDIGVYSGPGDLYYFEGQANQTIMIDAMVNGTSSSMDPFIALIDAKQNILGTDDDSGTDKNAYLSYDLPSDGRYYIIVIDQWNSSGPDYTYTIKVTR